MEVVGLTAAAISIAKTAQMVARLVKLLYRVAKNSSSVGNQMQYFAINFRNTVDVVKVAMEALERTCQDNIGSPVIRHIVEMNQLHSLQQESWFLQILVKDLRHEIPNIESRWDVITSFRWTRMKPEMEALFAPMTSLKTNLNLMINVVLLGNLSARTGESRTAELERQIDLLKTQINEQMETIRQLREEAQYIPPITRRSTAASNARTVDSQVTLCHLAKNMVERERVPSTPPETFTFTKPKRKRHSRHSSDASSGSSTRTHQRPRASSPVTPPSPPQTHRSSPRPVEVRPTEANDISNGEAPHSPQTAPPDEAPPATRQNATAPPPIPTSASTPSPASTSASGSKLTSEPTSEPDTEPSESPKPKPRRERIKRTSNTTQDGTDLHNTVVAGWVPTASGDQIIEAYIDRRLKYNLISRKLREQLGLAIEQHTGQTVGQYNGKAWRSLGTATLEWGSNGDSCRCYVIDELERPLIFGRMFPLSGEQQ